MLQAMRKQLQGELIRKGFIPEDMIKLFYVAGLYPMMGRSLPPKNGNCVVEVLKLGCTLSPLIINYHFGNQRLHFSCL